MSTRSFVGSVDTEGQFKARYVHSDGYPTSMGETLAELVEREGVETVVATLTEDHYGWSNLSADTPDIKGVRANADAPWGSPAKQASLFRGERAIYGDGRFANVAGWGTAYTTKGGRSSADAWVEGGINFDSGEVFGLEGTWCEWGYVFDADGVLHVIEVVAPEGKTNASGTVITSVTADDLSGFDWGKAECGADFERCTHYAWYHDKTVPEGSRNLSMDVWLGREELGFKDAVAVIVAGQRITLTGSGCVASYLRKGETVVGPKAKSRSDWVSSGKTEDGGRVNVVTKTADGSPAPGVHYIYPEVKATATA